MVIAKGQQGSPASVLSLDSFHFCISPFPFWNHGRGSQISNGCRSSIAVVSGDLICAWMQEHDPTGPPPFCEVL